MSVDGINLNYSIVLLRGNMRNEGIIRLFRHVGLFRLISK